MPSYMFGLAFSMMQLGTFLFSPFWGVLATIIQPKIVLLLGGLGYGLGQYIFSIAKTQSFLLFGRFVSGFSVSATTVVAVYMLVKLTDSTSRKKWMPLLITAFLVSGTFGQFIGGIIGNENTLAPFYLQIGLLVLCGVLFFITLPNIELIESITLKEGLSKSNPIRAFLSIKDSLTPDLKLQFIVVFIISFASTSLSQTFGYYIVDVLGKGSSLNGFARGIVGFLSMALNAMFVAKFITQTSRKKGFIGVLVIIILSSAMMVIGSLNVITFVTFAILAMSFDTIPVALLQEKSTSIAKEEQQGLVLGAHNSMKSLGGVIGASVAGVIYDVRALLPFIMVVVLYALATLLIKKQK